MNHQLEGAIDRLLTYLCCSEEGGMSGWVFTEGGLRDIGRSQLSFMRLPLTYFNRADPFAGFEEFQGLTKGYERLFFWPDEISPSDLAVEDWDVATFKPSPEDESGATAPIVPNDIAYVGRTGIYHLERVRRVPLREVRGFFRLRSGIIIEHSIADIFRNGTFETSRTYCELRNGKWWAVGQPREIFEGMVNDAAQANIEWSKSIAFTSYYDWRVELSVRRDMPSLSFVTDPIGSREIFRLRDIPAGASRRAALRHWVTGHWRKKRSDDTEDVKIWPYIRGQQEFEWNGLYCKIHPSKHDLMRAKQYQLMASKNKGKASVIQ